MKYSDMWMDIETAPRNGDWFVARTEGGDERKVHFADKHDRLPIDHSEWVWVTMPVEWKPLGLGNVR